MSKKCCISKNFSKLTGLFKALSEPNRLNIFSHFCSSAALGTTEINVNDLQNCCDVDLSVVSRHLSVLREAGVLNSEKKGKEVLYSLNGSELVQLLRKLADQIEQSEKILTKNKEYV